MPGQWGKVTKATGDGADHFTAMVASLKAIEEHTKNVTRAQASSNQKLDGTLLSFGKLRKFTSGIATDMANVTFNLLKWTALGGALSLAGGFFGMDSLARAATATRRQSLGLGVTPGELKAAQVNYSPYMNVDQTLGNIADAKSDLSKRWAFNALGISNSSMQTKDAAELLPELIPKLVAAFKRTGQTTQGADALGLTNFVDVDTLRRLSKLSPQELAKTAQSYGRDKNTLGLSEDTLKKWTELDKQLERSKSTIETVLIDKLSGLAGPIGELSDAFTTALTDILSNPDLGKYMHDLGDEIVKFAKYIGSPVFKEEVSRFVSGVGQLADKILWALDKLGIIDIRTEKEKADSEDAHDQGDVDAMSAMGGGAVGSDAYSKLAPSFNAGTTGASGSKGWGGKEHAAARDATMAWLVGHGYTTSQAAALAGNFAQESGFDDQAQNAQGNFGLAQWGKARQKAFAAWAGYDIHDKRANREKQLEFVDYELHHDYKKSVLDKLNEHPNDTAANTDVVTRSYEAPGDSSGQARQMNAANIQHNFVVKIDNNTGGNATATAASLATPAS